MVLAGHDRVNLRRDRGAEVGQGRKVRGRDVEVAGVADLVLLPFSVRVFVDLDGGRDVFGVQVEAASACDGEGRVHAQEFAVPKDQRQECLPVLGFLTWTGEVEPGRPAGDLAAGVGDVEEGCLGDQVEVEAVELQSVERWHRDRLAQLLQGEGLQGVLPQLDPRSAGEVGVEEQPSFGGRCRSGAEGDEAVGDLSQWHVRALGDQAARLTQTRLPQQRLVVRFPVPVGLGVEVGVFIPWCRGGHHFLQRVPLGSARQLRVGDRLRDRRQGAGVLEPRQYGFPQGEMGAHTARK